MKASIPKIILLFNCLSCSSPVEENIVINFKEKYPSILEYLTEKRSETESVAIEVKESLKKVVDKEYTNKIKPMKGLVKIIIDIMSLEDLQKAKEVSEKIAEGGYKGGAHDDQVLNELEEILGHKIVSTEPDGRYDYINRYNSYNEDKDYGEAKEEDLTALKKYVDTKKLEILKNNMVVDTEPSMNKDVREALRILSSIKIYSMKLREIEELVNLGVEQTGDINFSERLLDLLTHPISIEDSPSDSSSKDNQKERDQGSTNKATEDDLRGSIVQVIKQSRGKIENVIFPVVRNNLCAVTVIMNKSVKRMVEIEVDENRLVRVTIATKKPKYIKGILSYLEIIAGSDFPVYELIFKGIDFKEKIELSNLSHDYMKNIKRIKFQSCYFEKDCFDISDIHPDCLESIEEVRIQSHCIKGLGSLKNLKSLKVLEICNHDLLNIPTSIIESVNLVELRIRKFLGDHNMPFRNIEDIAKLVNLETLSLSDNKLKCIPKAITKMVNLKKLVLKDNRISTIDENINKLVNLEELILDNNEALKLSSNTKINLPNLKYLSMENCGLPSTRKDEGSNSSSSVSDNSTFYSNLFGKLPKLEKLNLSWNQNMDILPSEILKMGNLKYLYAKVNRIGSDPKKGLFGTDIEGDKPLLTSLKRLVLDGNNMQVFPSDIMWFRGLEELSMNRCVPKSLKKQNLISLHKKLMSKIGSKFKETPQSLQSIKILRLSGWYLEVLPFELAKLTSLEYLDLSESRLKVLPSEIGNLTKLEYLDLSWNRDLFSSAHLNTIFNIKSLKVLEMRDCGLKGRLSKEIGNLINLRALDLSRNSGLILPKEISNLKELRELYLENIEIPTKDGIADSELLPKEPLELPNLRLLSLRKTKLSGFPDIICEFKSLNILRMSYTGIKELPKNFSNLKNLQKLSMSDNEIEEIPWAIFNISTLESLYLSNNNITKVPSDILKLSKLTTLDIGSTRSTIPFLGDIVFLLSLKKLYIDESIVEDNYKSYFQFLFYYRKVDLQCFSPWFS